MRVLDQQLKFTNSHGARLSPCILSDKISSEKIHKSAKELMFHDGFERGIHICRPASPPKLRSRRTKSGRVTVYLPAGQAKALRVGAAMAEEDLSTFTSKMLEKAGVKPID
jgi:hypothetical protein